MTEDCNRFSTRCLVGVHTRASDSVAYDERKDTQQVGGQSIYCCDCCKFTTLDHDCDPVCKTCSSHFRPGAGCRVQCDTAHPCCGCCGPNGNSISRVIFTTVSFFAMGSNSAGPNKAPTLTVRNPPFPSLKSYHILIGSLFFSDCFPRTQIHHGGSCCFAVLGPKARC